MATQAQILANRSNAQKSTGPRTAAGKTIVSRNAVKHGLCGRDIVIHGEDPGEFESYRDRMLAELDPLDEIESDLAERIVSLSWRLQRAERLQAAAFDSLYAQQRHCVAEQLDKKQDADGDSTFGRALVRDFANNRVLDRLLMYERRIEHSLYRTMAELKRHRILQEVGPGQMWELRRALASEEPVHEQAAESGVQADCREPACSVPVRAYPRSEEDKITPHGVTTNEDKTTPDGVPASDEGRATRPTAGMLHASPVTLHDPSCKTKPIRPAPDDGQVSWVEALTADARGDAPEETKPIPEQAPGTTSQ